MTSVTCCFFVDRDVSMTGAPRSVLDLLTGLEERGVATSLVTQRESALTDQLQSGSTIVEIQELPTLLDVHDEAVLNYSRWDFVRAGRQLIDYNRQVTKVIQKLAPDVVIARQVKGVLLTGPAARRLGIPLVWDVGMEKQSRGVVYWLHWLGLVLANRVITQAERQHREIFGRLRSWIWARKLVAITPGVGRDRRQRLEQAAKRREPYDRDILRVVTVGSVHPRKGHETAIRAMANLKERGVEFKFKVVGPVRAPDYYEELMGVVDEEDLTGEVEFLGWRDDVAEILGGSDVFLLASTIEGVPQVVREAMFAGLPVVATDVGGVPEVVENGVTGILVDAGDPEAMTQALRRLARSRDLRAGMGRNGQHVARERFSMDRWLECYEGTLDGLCADY